MNGVHHRHKGPWCPFQPVGPRWPAGHPLSLTEKTWKKLTPHARKAIVQAWEFRGSPHTPCTEKDDGNGTTEYVKET